MEMMTFESKYNLRDRKSVSHVGSPVKQTFIGRYDPNGDVELVPSGIIDTYSEIQSYADECSMDNILRRFAAGDVSVLNQAQGVFVDVSQMPTHFTDMVNLVSAVEREFNLLPADERAKYENNFVKYALRSDQNLDNLNRESFATDASNTKAESNSTVESEVTL